MKTEEKFVIHKLLSDTTPYQEYITNEKGFTKDFDTYQDAEKYVRDVLGRGVYQINEVFIKL